MVTFLFLKKYDFKGRFGPQGFDLGPTKAACVTLRPLCAFFLQLCLFSSQTAQVKHGFS